MAGSSEKVPIASAGPEDLQQFMPPAYSAVAVKPTATGRLLKAGIAVLIAGALLLLLGAVGAFYFWNNNEKHVYNVHYSMSINGKVEEGTMEIDTANNMERFSTGSGADEAVEVHDFEIGITGIRFSGGEKCYIKTQVKARLPDVEALNKDSMTFDLEDEVMPAKFEDDLIWVAADTPLSDSAFLSNKIKDLCGDLPIFWLRPTYSTSGQRKRRAALRQRRQAAVEGEQEGVEAEFNPENPYMRGLEGEEDTMNINPMLDHQGVCCTECRRSYTHCQRICEPLGGYEPWPYHYRGCRVVCRVIMPCNWWVARILGLV
ncbi:leukocyte cell-derived chemotaxin 1-like [Micropterus salmoides]|uniref:leukocyte cell-derived chemotaxin 1-like n=1 Tax=Micropterus salmoides TaxID=27706 RepID=UPI0018EC198A|nr:leukocyte cell-derived chemotaxin 1-like [Micropterus salmoides]XP_045908111.1 leukocyte cell-derived chemotaxin 1-like [Micropterus dolomieu]